MSLTSTEELRIKAIESKLNTFQQAIRNLASKEELKQLLLVKETVEVILREIVDETVNMSALIDTNLAGLTNNQILQYNSTQQMWIPVDPGGDDNHNLGELSDVTLTNVIDQSFIMYDSASDEWIDVSLMTLDPSSGTITMLPVDPGVVKVDAGYMDRSELDDNTLITKSYVDGKIALVNPVGAVIAYGGTTVPGGGWLFCDGATISRTTYSDLYAVTGDLHGAGDGSTTFDLPDYNDSGSGPQKYIIKI